jgi:hypothetical protein
MVHGLDVARAILAVHNQFDLAAGLRWIVTDGRVCVPLTITYLSITLSSFSYDWWDLASAWGDGGEGNRDKVPSGLQPQVKSFPSTYFLI